MIQREALHGLRDAVVEGDAENCKAYAEKAIKLGIDAYEAIVKGCAEGMLVVGDKYQKREYFIPELLLSAEAMYAAIEVLKPYLQVEKSSNSLYGRQARGKILLGVIEGDVHDIGKNLVKILLEADGFDVLDLGRDVSIDTFIGKTKETSADVIAVSTFMTTTLPGIKLLINKLKEEGMKDNVKVIIGGAATSKVFAEKVGADAWARDAVEGVKAIRALLAEGK
jgi:dimethylamine corrinoid protein